MLCSSFVTRSLTLLNHCSSSLSTLQVLSSMCFAVLFSAIEECDADILISMVALLLLSGRLSLFSNALDSFLSHSLFFSGSFWLVLFAGFEFLSFPFSLWKIHTFNIYVSRFCPFGSLKLEEIKIMKLRDWQSISYSAQSCLLPFPLLSQSRHSAVQSRNRTRMLSCSARLPFNGFLICVP